jgi:chaperonin GroES
MSDRSNFEPLKDRILARQLNAEEEQRGGIVIPLSAQERPTIADVIRVGKAVRDVRVGNRVAFGKWSGDKVDINGVEHLLLREKEILALLEKS